MNATEEKLPVRGQVLAGKYRVERVLGTGGMGIVIAATHLDLHELRAIKLMYPASAGDAEAVERFLREARAAVQLRSDHVARVLDVGRLESGAPYIVMEHLTGSDLGKLTKRRGPLPIEDAALYVAQAASAIAEAHAAGIVHRDLKPSNLFLTTARDGSPCIKLLDFGISKIVRPESDASLDMTKTRQMLGSPLYMAPEQMRSSHVADARVDVWGLGVILYRLVTGKLPFFGHGLLEVCTVVLEKTPVPPSALRPDLPPELEALILRCLVKDPAGRLASAAELAAALAPFTVPRARAPEGPPERIEEQEAAPGSVGARTTPFDIDSDIEIPVELVDEPEMAPRTEAPAVAAPAKRRAAPAPRRPLRVARPPKARARSALSLLVAVLAGIVGSGTVLAGGGALVSRHEALEVPQRVARRPVTDPSASGVEAPRARPAPFAAAVCPAVPVRPIPPGPGGPDDPFRVFERGSRVR